MVLESIITGALIAGPCRQYGSMTLCEDGARIYKRGNDYQVHRPSQPIQNFYQYGNTAIMSSPQISNRRCTHTGYCSPRRNTAE
jgi:hypothetical protein